MEGKSKKTNKHKKSKVIKEPNDTERDENKTEEVEETRELDENEVILPKRYHTDDDSENENEPKKKKKKRKPIISSDTNSKNKKSIRQAKREKFAQRQAESQAAAKEQLKSQCLNYLSQWKHNRQNWKFMKAKQVWLYKNKFSESLLPNDSWPLLLEYFESAKGNIRNMLLEDANKVIIQMDDWTEAQSKEDKVEDEDLEQTEDSKKPSDVSYKRARDLIQFLQE